MEIKIGTRTAFSLFAAFLVLVSYCAAVFGAPAHCDYRGDCESLLVVWRTLVMGFSLLATIPVVLFGIFQVHK
jgi:hypothetical protein